MPVLVVPSFEMNSSLRRHQVDERFQPISASVSSLPERRDHLRGRGGRTL
jgi:hypothetical protein